MTILTTKPLVHQSTSSTGPGNLTLDAEFGAQGFAAAFGIGIPFVYYIQHRTAAGWECGIGHMVDAVTLARDTILASINGTTVVNFGAGVKDVSNDLSPDANAARDSLLAAPFEAQAFNNIAVNGNHVVAQQWLNNLASGITNLLYYVTDQWAIGAGGAVVAAGQRNQSNPPPGFTDYLRIAVTTADTSITTTDYLSLLQLIEGYRCARLGYGAAGALPSSWGFWIRSSITGTFTFSLRNNGGARSYIKTFTINAANTWEFKSFVVPGDTMGTWAKDNSLGMYFGICFAGGSTFQGTDGIWQAVNVFAVAGQTNGAGTVNTTFDVTGVVGLPGNTDLAAMSDRIPLLMRPFDEELRICQRYWEASYDYGMVPGTVTPNGIFAASFNATYNGFPSGPKFIVPKRDVPAMQAWHHNNGTLGSWQSDGGAVSITWINIGTRGIRYVTASAGTAWLEGQWVANARM